MRNVKKLVLIMALAGPSVLTMSCFTGVGRVMWDAAVEGASMYVTGATFDALEANINPDADG